MLDIHAVSDEIKGMVDSLHPDWKMTSSLDDFGEYERHSIYIHCFKPSSLTPGKVEAGPLFYVSPNQIRVSGTAIQNIDDWKSAVLAALGVQPALSS